ncbi:isoprenylcysteine carboxylmethyltransferase family protein [Mesorhizobium sp. SP-1A]|uniref:methyltransferase family protein n=1 Tax=Mesorhizobium sp. SP-1A TaxID=3077840 RepID=UPI0028F704C2|nr:isoprenylcysteine carboxylmethyltransferase family protein [Mesorhizobium sp. SP-1A]
MATFIIALVAVILWLGLAAWGWGGVGPFLSHPARVALVAVTLGLTAAASFTSGNLSPGEREESDNRWVLVAFLIIGILDGFLPAYCDRTGLWTFGGDGVRWLGVAFFLAGGVLRLWPVFVLGWRFSGLVAIQKDHQLVTDGIYGLIRNPSYLGLLVSVFGWALAFRSAVGLILAALFIPPLIVRIHSEERLLAQHFGAAYEAYRARTWRLVPYIY